MRRRRGSRAVVGAVLALGAAAWAAAAGAAGVAGAAGAAAEPAWRDVYRLWVVRGFYTTYEEVVALRQVRSARGTYWMAERRLRTRTLGGPTVKIERDWIYGRKCPALAEVVAGAARVKAGASQPMVFHGANTHLGALGPDGRYAVQVDYEGALTAWWREAEAKLKPCWGAALLLDDGERLPLTLETDADEAPFRALRK